MYAGHTVMTFSTMVESVGDGVSTVTYLHRLRPISPRNPDGVRSSTTPPERHQQERRRGRRNPQPTPPRRAGAAAPIGTVIVLRGNGGCGARSPDGMMRPFATTARDARRGTIVCRMAPGSALPSAASAAAAEGKRSSGANAIAFITQSHSSAGRSGRTFGQGRDLVLEVAGDELRDRVALDGVPAGEHVVAQAARRHRCPCARPAAGGAAAPARCRGSSRRSSVLPSRLCTVGWVTKRARPKSRILYCHDAAGQARPHDVLRLDVAVDQAGLMGGDQRLQRLLRRVGEGRRGRTGRARRRGPASRRPRTR